MTRSSMILGLVLAAGGLGMTQSAFATISISPTFLTVRATVGASVGEYSIPTSSVVIDDLDLDGNADYYFYESLVAIPVYEGVNQSSGNIVAQIASISLTAVQYDLGGGLLYWSYAWNFLMTGGSDTTQFDIFSPLMTTDTVTGALATCSASLYGQDIYQDGPNPDNVTVVPNLLSGHAFVADYNNGSNIFRQYINATTSTDSVDGITGNMTPLDSFEPVPGSLSNMSFQYSFTVTRWDNAGGTGTYGAYALVPSPSSAALLGLGGLVLARRRRR